MSCSVNGSEISRGIPECKFAVLVTTSRIYSYIPPHANTIAYSVKVSDFHILFHAE